MTRKPFLTILVCMLSMPLSLLADNDDLSQLFGQFDIEGTLLIESVDARSIYPMISPVIKPIYLLRLLKYPLL